MKAIILVIDGLADRPVKALNYKTPLEASDRNNLNALAEKGITGILDPISPGIRAGSDTSHLAILGYDPFKVYTGRGPFEASGMGIELTAGDVAFRCNFATVDNNLIVKDRRAGRIENTEELEKAITEKVKLEVDYEFKSIKYRAALVLKGKGLSSEVSDTDPHESGVEVKKPEALKKEAEKTAELLWDFSIKAHKVLKEHPINKNRELPANFLLVRGGGITPKLISFKEKYNLNAACIATTAIIKGITKLAGFDMIEAEADYSARISQAIDALNTRDIVLINIKEADEAGHDNKPEEKIRVIEKLDRSMDRLLEFVRENYLVVLPDHSTPCSVGEHTGDTVPVLIAGPEVRSDSVERFDERSTTLGGLGRIRAKDIMPIILDLINKSHKFGA